MVLFLDAKETMRYGGRIHFLSTVIENGRFTLLHCTSTLSYPAMSGQNEVHSSLSLGVKN
jgi:hypothetical protein